MSIKIIFLSLLLCFIIGCGNGNAQNSQNTQNSQTYKLPSGKEIKVNGVGKITFQNGDTALMMNYETEIPIENEEELNKEVEEIWSVFQKDVEKAELKIGIIRATHYEGSAIMRKGKGYGFVYNKGEDGKWHRLENEEKKK